MKRVYSTRLMAEGTDKMAARTKFIEGEKEESKPIVQLLLRNLRQGKRMLQVKGLERHVSI